MGSCNTRSADLTENPEVGNLETWRGSWNPRSFDPSAWNIQFFRCLCSCFLYFNARQFIYSPSRPVSWAPYPASVQSPPYRGRSTNDASELRFDMHSVRWSFTKDFHEEWGFPIVQWKIKKESVSIETETPKFGSTEFHLSIDATAFRFSFFPSDAAFCSQWESSIWPPQRALGQHFAFGETLNTWFTSRSSGSWQLATSGNWKLVWHENWVLGPWLPAYCHLHQASSGRLKNSTPGFHANKNSTKSTA